MTWLLLPLLFACDGNRDKNPPVDDNSDIVPPTVTLQLAGIDPSTASNGRSFPAELFGSGFARGATVAIVSTERGSQNLGPATYMSETVLSVVIPALSNGSYDVVVTNPDGKKATLKRGLTIQDPPVTVSADKCGSLTVYFALDSSTIPAEFRSTLDSWAGCVRSADLPVRIEGHCDERGTTEYNLALGQRRADSVARYLTGMGIPKVRITAVSYGEEHAVTTGSEEGSWSKNRRAELSARP